MHWPVVYYCVATVMVAGWWGRLLELGRGLKMRSRQKNVNTFRPNKLTHRTRLRNLLCSTVVVERFPS